MTSGPVVAKIYSDNDTENDLCTTTRFFNKVAFRQLILRKNRKLVSCSLYVQAGSGAHPASCTMGTGFLSPGLKRGRGVTLTTHPHLVPRSMSRSYTSKAPSWRVVEQLYLF
jgi:hypothetical protein